MSYFFFGELANFDTLNELDLALMDADTVSFNLVAMWNNPRPGMRPRVRKFLRLPAIREKLLQGLSHRGSFMHGSQVYSLCKGMHLPMQTLEENTYLVTKEEGV